MTSKNVKLCYFFFGALFHLAIFLMPFQFQTNDDSRMMMLVAGDFSGYPGDYAVYLHPLLSDFIGKLYQINSKVFWYPILWFLFFYSSYLGYVIAVTIKVPSKQIQFVFVLAFLAFAFHSLFYLQFTVVAGVLGFSGYLLILLHYQNYQVSKSELFFAYFLCFMSLLVRKESFYLITAGFGLLSFLEFGLKTTIKILWKEIGFILIIIFLLVFTPFYETIHGYKEYIDFNKARSQVLDHPLWQIIDVGSKWGENAHFLQNWFFRDNPWVTVEKLNFLKRELNSYYFDSTYFSHSYNNLWEKITYNKFLIGWSVLVCLTHKVGKGNIRKKLFFCIIWFGMIIMLSPFFLLHPRVQALFLLMFLGLSIIFYNPHDNPSLLTCFVLAGLFILLSSIHGINIKGAIDQKKSALSGLNQLIDHVPTNKVYFMDSESLNLMQLNPKFINEKGNQLFYLGWNSYHPADTLLLKRLGYNSLHEIFEFYFIHSQDQKDLLLPSYLTFLNGFYEREVIEIKGGHVLMYFKKGPTSK